MLHKRRKQGWIAFQALHAERRKRAVLVINLFSGPFDYPIRTRAAAAAAGLLLLLEGTGALFRSGVTQEREPQRKGICIYIGVCTPNMTQDARAYTNAHTRTS
eukprot:1160482-Pelagomonas_calceolata.AAC.11